MSTTSRSPGSAPSISTGPLSMCATLRSTSRTSLAEALLPSWPSVHSRHSIRNSEPGRTEAADGMSGCHRVWPGTAWSRIDFDWSTLNSTSGTVGSLDEFLIFPVESILDVECCQRGRPDGCARGLRGLRDPGLHPGMRGDAAARPGGVQDLRHAQRRQEQRDRLPDLVLGP